MRIGFGYDVHRLVDGKPLLLGGVEVPFPKGLLGHSDADVLLHAIIDSMIGAAGLGDIGSHFPPNDMAFKGISSMELLKRAFGLLKKEGCSVANTDSTIVCEAPKLAPYIPQMRENISGVLKISVRDVNVKAKTEEGLGFTGSGEGISAYAVTMIERGAK